MLQSSSVSLEESKVGIRSDDVDVALDVLLWAVKDVEDERRPGINISSCIDRPSALCKGTAKKSDWSGWRPCPPARSIAYVLHRRQVGRLWRAACGRWKYQHLIA